MSPFAETSFLCAVLRTQDNSHVADDWMAAHSGPIWTSTLVIYEFTQGVHFQTWLHRHDRGKGYNAREAAGMLARLEENISLGIIRIGAVDWTAVHERSNRLAERHTPAAGARGFDLLHVATALLAESSDFLSFDSNQRDVAIAEGLAVHP